MRPRGYRSSDVPMSELPKVPAGPAPGMELPPDTSWIQMEPIRKSRAEDFIATRGQVARPGDTLILGFERVMSAAEAQQIKDLLKSKPTLDKVEIVIISGCSSVTVVQAA